MSSCAPSLCSADSPHTASVCSSGALCPCLYLPPHTGQCMKSTAGTDACVHIDVHQQVSINSTLKHDVHYWRLAMPLGALAWLVDVICDGPWAQECAGERKWVHE